jgi:hypothetical protein
MNIDLKTELRDYQEIALDDPTKRKMLWWARRTGKDLFCAIEALDWAFSPGGRKDSKVLILGPQKAHVMGVFKKIWKILSDSGLGRFTDHSRRDPPLTTFLFPDGGSCRIVGHSCFSKGLRPCGVDANKIIVNEPDYCDESLLADTINPILHINPECGLVLVGTPRQDKNSYMNRCYKSELYNTYRANIYNHPDYESCIDKVLAEFGGETDQFKQECLVPFPN